MSGAPLSLLLASALFWALWRALRSFVHVAANIVGTVFWLALAAGIAGLLVTALAMFCATGR